MTGQLLSNQTVSVSMPWRCKLSRNTSWNLKLDCGCGRFTTLLDLVGPPPCSCAPKLSKLSAALNHRLVRKELASPRDTWCRGLLSMEAMAQSALGDWDNGGLEFFSNMQNVGTLTRLLEQRTPFQHAKSGFLLEGSRFYVVCTARGSYLACQGEGKGWKAWKQKKKREEIIVAS